MEVGLQNKNVSVKESLQRRVKYKVGKFCEIIRPKIVAYQNNFVLPQYSTHMKLPNKTSFKSKSCDHAHFDHNAYGQGLCQCVGLLELVHQSR